MGQAVESGLGLVGALGETSLAMAVLSYIAPAGVTVSTGQH